MLKSCKSDFSLHLDYLNDKHMPQNEKRNNDQDDFYFLLIHTSVFAFTQFFSPLLFFLFTKYICKLLTVNLVLNVAVTEYSNAV